MVSSLAEALASLFAPDPQQRLEAALYLADQPGPETRQALLNALGDEEARVREAIVQALIKHADPDLVAQLVPVAHEEKPGRRNTALSAIIAIGGQWPDILWRALSHPSLEVRRHIAEVLGDIRDPRNTPSLLERLNDPAESTNVRHAAAQSLGKLGDQAVTPALVAAAEQGDFWVRYAAVEALGRIGDPAAVESLLRLMQDDAWMRPAIVEALGAIGHVGAVQALAAVLNDANPTVRTASLEALTKIVIEPGHAQAPNPSTLDEFRRVIPLEPVRRELNECPMPGCVYAAHLLGWLKHPEALPDLIAALGQEEETLRHAALEAILRYGAAALPSLVEALSHSQAHVREHAAELLGMLGDAALVPELLAHVHDADLAVRLAILHALGSLGGEPAYAGLLQALKDPATRDAALGILGQARGPRLAGNLKHYLQNFLYEGEPDMRAAAAQALSLFGDEVAVSILLNAIRQPDLTMRRLAAEALARVRGSRSVNTLIEALGDRDWLVRQSAVEALGGIPDGRAVAALLTLAHDPEWRVRQALVMALRRVGDSRIFDPLQDLAHDSDRWIRRVVMEQCAMLDDRRAIEILLGGLHDDEPSVRRTALRVLGQRRDPSAAIFVAEHLTDPQPEIRVAVVHALAQMDLGLALERLPLLVHDPEEAVRRVVADGLGELGNEEGIEALEVLLKDEATTVRGEAVEALAHIGTLRAAEVLVATLSYEPVKAQIQVQLANMGQLATRALLRTARAAEPELRAVAAETLGQLRSPHALPTLRLLLRDPDTRVRQAAEKAMKMVEEG